VRPEETCSTRVHRYRTADHDKSPYFHPAVEFHRCYLRFFFILALTIWLLTVPFDRRLVWLHMFTSFWACLYLWIVPAWSVTTAGRDKIRRGATYIVVSNHQSQLDILVAFHLFFPFKWVSKAEIFKLPFIGWNMVLNRYIRLKRGDKESIRQMMAACERTLAQGCSVFFFPEGTRSRDGHPKPFRMIGLKTLTENAPSAYILPVSINNSWKMLRHGKFPLGIGNHLKFEVHPPIPARNCTKETLAAVEKQIIENIQVADS